MGSKGSNTTKSTQSLPPEFRAAYTESLNRARAAANTPYQQYQGQLVAGINPTLQQGISNVNAAQGVALPFIQQGAGYTQMAAQGITPELYERFYSPYVRDVANATQANILESNAQQQSGLKSGAIQAGAFGGDRSGIALAEMARQQGLAGAQSMSQIYNQGYGQAMQLAGQQAQNYGAMGQQLAGLGGAAQGAILQGAQAQLAAGAQQQATEQAQLQSLYDQYQQKQGYPYQQAQFFANIAQGLGSTSGGTSTTTAPPPSAASQIMGGIGAIGTIASLSDERAKEAIEPVGKLFDGQMLYRFRYKGDPSGRTHVGLMAQDVEQHKPSAVTEIDGVKGVDYHDATDEAASMASAGGAVGGGLGRAAFAEGGMSYAPWGGGSGWVPEGKIGGMGSGSRIPEAPEPFKDEGLAEDWMKTNPLSDTQVEGLGKIKDIFGSLGKTDPIPYPLTNTFGGPKAHGGLVRSAHAEGGMPFDRSVNRTFEFEGGLNPRDTNGTPSNMGINAAANPDVDVENLSRDEARRLYKTRYWDAIGGDDLARTSPGLAHVAFDTAVIAGPGRAKEFLEASGGDPEKFMALRSNFLNGLAAKNPGKYGKYVKAWNNRNAGLLSDIGGKGSSGGLSGAEAIMPMSDEPPQDGSGLAGGDQPMGKGLGRFFASDKNPSIIESLMGRRVSPEAKAAMLNASFALMAGRSPFFMTNVGEAGKVGTQTYYNALAQKRELAKMQGELGLRGYEAQTGRMQVDVADANSRRQQAALVIPLIRSLVALGQPVPEAYLRILNDAYPSRPGEPSRIMQELGVGQGAAAGAIAPGVPAIPGVPSAEPGGEPAEAAPAGGAPVEPEPAPTPPAASAGDPAPIPPPDVATGPTARELMQKLPPTQNPYTLMEDAQRAKAAGDAELYRNLTEEANKLFADYRQNGIPLPDGSGVIPFPGVQENAARGKRLEAAAVGETNQALDYGKGMTELQSSFTPRTMIVNGLSDALASAESGKFAELQADLVNAAASLGFTNANQIAEAEDAQVAMKYFAQGILGSGMKDQIGPQISNADLLLVAKGQGTIENLPVANRKIIGAMKGKLAFDRAKAAAFDEFVASKGGMSNLSPTDIRNWERSFSTGDNSIAAFVERGIAETPVAGELNVARPPSYMKEGYRYIDPRNGRTFIFNGYKDINGQRVPDAEYLN